MNSEDSFQYLTSEFQAGKWSHNKYILRAAPGFFLPKYPAEYGGYAIVAVYVDPEVTNLTIHFGTNRLVHWRQKMPKLETESELETILEESRNADKTYGYLSNYNRIKLFSPFIYCPKGQHLYINPVNIDCYIEYYIVPEYDCIYNTAYPMRGLLNADELDVNLGIKLYCLDRILLYQCERVMGEVIALIRTLDYQINGNMNIDDLALLDQLELEEHKIN